MNVKEIVTQGLTLGVAIFIALLLVYIVNTYLFGGRLTTRMKIKMEVLIEPVVLETM